MKKIIKKCGSKSEAEKLKNKAVKMGFNAVCYLLKGKNVCMISSADDIPEQIANDFLSGSKNRAKQGLLSAK